MLRVLRKNSMACMFLLFALQSVNSLFAQSIQIGLKVGANMSRLAVYGYPIKDFAYSWRPDFLAGGIAQYSINKQLAIQTELIYSRKRTQQVANDNAVSNFSYLSLPLLLSYRVSDGWYAEVGPEFNYLLDAKLATGEMFDKARNVVGVVNIGAFRRFRSSICLGLRYGYGLTGISDPLNVTDISGNKTGTIKIRSQTFQLTSTYFLP